MRRLIPLAVAAWLSFAATAGAQAISTATPSKAGKGTRLHFDVDSTLPPVAGRLPKGLTFSAPAGYRLDFQAAPKRCNSLQAKLDECPGKSRIGKGSLLIQVTQPGQVRDVSVPLAFYLKSKKDVFAVAFLAGTRVIPGTIGGSGGMTLTFNPLPDPPSFPQVSYLLKRVTIDVGVNRKVAARTARRGKGKRRKARIKVHSFIRNPPQCPGPTGWASAVTFTYSDGTADVVPTPMACTA